MACLSILTASCCFGAFGQAIGVEVVVDTAFYGVTDPPSTLDPDGQLDGYVSYLVYAKFQNPTDVLSSIFADAMIYPEGSGIGPGCPLWLLESIDGSMVMDDTNNSLLWLSPDYSWNKYDTFLTIGNVGQ